MAMLVYQRVNPHLPHFMVAVLGVHPLTNLHNNFQSTKSLLSIGEVPIVDGYRSQKLRGVQFDIVSYISHSTNYIVDYIQLKKKKQMNQPSRKKASMGTFEIKSGEVPLSINIIIYIYNS